MSTLWESEKPGNNGWKRSSKTATLFLRLEVNKEKLNIGLRLFKSKRKSKRMLKEIGQYWLKGVTRHPPPTDRLFDLVSTRKSGDIDGRGVGVTRHPLQSVLTTSLRITVKSKVRSFLRFWNCLDYLIRISGICFMGWAWECFVFVN